MVEFRLLGAVDIALPEDRSPRSVLSRPKDLALLAYLALATPRGFRRRDTLLALFWPSSDESRARAALNQALYRLRQALGEDLLATRGAEEVGLKWDLWWCDVVALRAAMAKQGYTEVLELYGGELLEGFHVNASAEFDHWLDAERSAARETAATAALHLAADAVQSGDELHATQSLRKALAIKPFEESILQRLMDLLHQRGEGHTALFEYERFAKRLATDLELEPSRQSVEVASRISDSMRAAVPTARPRVPSDSAVPSPPRKSRTRLVTAIVAALLLPTLGAYVVYSADRSADSHDGTKGIVVADFVNRTREENLAAAVTEALYVDLSQSHLIRVASGFQVGAVLKRMGRDTTSALSEGLAREVALRDGFSAVLRGEVAAAGSGYIISAQLITADSGRVLVSVREQAMGAQDVIKAIDRLSERLRKRMGDSWRGAHTNQPLEAVTTHSLEALKLYSAGLRLVRYADLGDGRTSGGLPGRVRPDNRSVTLFEQAIALDSSFAAAYRALGMHLSWFMERPRSREMLTRAYQLRQQLTERERLQTEGTYFHFVTGDYDRAIACFEQLLERDPNDIIAIQQLAYLYFRRREFEGSVDLYERDWKMRGGTPAILYTSALLGAGRIDRADSILQHFARLDSTGGLWHSELLRVKAGRGDFAAVDTLLPRMLALAARSDPQTRFQSLVFAGRWKIWRGRYTEGMELLDNALGPNGAGLFGEIKTAQQEIYVLRDAARARRRLAAAVAKFPPEKLPPAERPYAFLANISAHAGDYQRAAEAVQAFRRHPTPPQSFAAADQQNRQFGSVEALASAAAGDIQKARQILAKAEQERCWYGSQERHLLRARVEDMAGHPDSAIAALERLVAPPTCGLTLSWSDVWAPHTQAYAHERLGELYFQRGDRKLAALHYTHFVQLWPDPDPLLRPRWLIAKRRLDQLARME